MSDRCTRCGGWVEKQLDCHGVFYVCVLCGEITEIEDIDNMKEYKDEEVKAMRRKDE